MFEVAFSRREHETAAAVDLERLAGDPPWHPANVLVTRGKESERRTTEVEAVAEGLALADADVNPERAGRLENPERQRIGADDDERSVFASRGDQRLEVLDSAEEVRLRDEHGADVVVERGGPRRQVGHAVAKRDLVDRHAIALRECVERLARVRMDAA